VDLILSALRCSDVLSERYVFMSFGEDGFCSCVNCYPALSQLLFCHIKLLLHDCILVVNENTTRLVVTGVQTIVPSFHCNIEVLCMVLGSYCLRRMRPRKITALWLE
jgi:hypothetical protein